MIDDIDVQRYAHACSMVGNDVKSSVVGKISSGMERGASVFVERAQMLPVRELPQ